MECLLCPFLEGWGWDAVITVNITFVLFAFLVYESNLPLREARNYLFNSNSIWALTKPWTTIIQTRKHFPPSNPFPFPLLSVFLSPYFSKCLAYPWNANSSVKIIWITYYITSLESTCHGWAWSFLLWFSHQFGDNINWPRHLEEEALHKIHGVKCYKIIGCWKYIWVEEMTMSFFLKVIWQWTFISVAKKSQSHKT